ncbi:class I SAM-dependent methyltransferase [Kordia jejudonensis]|uniref:class I SAM-dependent methyltransferase n=1 Tax=Kordia jejudonensis TaxID=1348245 RepID=UPI0006292B2E|nr:class I SAM-dependent methyltransferase [Kordia jejudonensis]
MTILKKIKSTLSKLKVKEIPEDIFILRLKSLVIGADMLHNGNIYLMDYALKNMPVDGVVIEIGSYGGLSTNLMLHLLKKHHRVEKLINCDPWIYEGAFDRHGEKSNSIDGRHDILREDYSTYMKTNFINSIQFLHKDNLPHSFQLTSDEFFSEYDKKVQAKDIFNQAVQLGSAISFAYIDGDHAYAYVKRDFENVDKHLMNSGFILFDDSMDDSPFGSTTFMKEMKANKNYQLVAKNPNYLFQKLA